MKKKTIIFYFSASGNSLYVAKNVARTMENVSLVCIAEAADDKAYKYEGYEKVGFIMPLYFMSMPKMVGDFIERLELKDTRYVFSITTRAYSKGKIFKDMSFILAKKGIRLNYGRYITYPDSYIRWAGPVKEEVRQGIYIQSDKNLEVFNKEILQEKNFIEKEGIILRTSAWFVYKIWKSRLSKNYKSFKVNGNCISCGICKNTCPAGNIELKEGLPVWSSKCEDCMACVQHCPQKAIVFNKKTNQKERYMHPQIALNELVHKH